MKTIPGMINGRKLTGMFRFKPDDGTAYIDMGNVVTHKRDTKPTVTPFKKARKGFIESVDEELAEIEDRISVKCNDFPTKTLEMMLFAKRGTDTNQNASVGVTGSITDIEIGGDYQIGARQISNLVITNPVGGGVYQEGTDYSVDAGSGWIKILGGSIVEGQALNLVFDTAEVNYANFTRDAQTFVRRGSVVFEEYDQNSKAPRSTHSFTATLSMKDRGDNDGIKYEEGMFDCLITSDVESTERLDS